MATAVAMNELSLVVAVVHCATVKPPSVVAEVEGVLVAAVGLAVGCWELALVQGLLVNAASLPTCHTLNGIPSLHVAMS